jgi:hypothetical protein
MKIFRRIRQKLLVEYKLGRYLLYALGEIVLVVIGILIALQINNRNQERLENEELQGILQAISTQVQADVKELNLLITARKTMGEKSKRIIEDFITTDRDSISVAEVTYVYEAFQEIGNAVSFQANLSTIESLTNSTYNKKIQNTDLAALLSAYYQSAVRIKSAESKYNEDIAQRNLEWFSRFRGNLNDQEIFLRPWMMYGSFDQVQSRFLEILRDVSTYNIIGSGVFEPFLISQYEEQILMGKALIRMIEQGETAFDEQTKLDFSGILFTYSKADMISVLINGKKPSGFTLQIVASGFMNHFHSYEEGYLELRYPENQVQWASPYFEVSALRGRVQEMDFSGYSILVLEMKGEKGGERFEIAMKDKHDPPDGTESRIAMELTDQWQTYEYDLSKFKTADLKTINVPFGIIFQGTQGQTIQLRTIQFKKQ